MNYSPGIGATGELSLRVSAATLVRVVFKHPGHGEWMLALERKATLQEHKVVVKSHPFGGAIRILDLDAIHGLIGDFHFDSESSRIEQDFRLFIQLSSWPVLRNFCIQHLNYEPGAVLETDPTRELVEEFADALKVNLQPEQYTCKPVATIIENEAVPTENIHARGYHTVRVYRIFEAVILSSTLVHAMLDNSESFSDQQMGELALLDARDGGKGRANAVCVLPLQTITDTYLDLPLSQRSSPVFLGETHLDDTVPAILEGIDVLKYQRL